MAVPAASPPQAVAAACGRLVAAIPGDLVPGGQRRPVRPPSAFTAAFGHPPVTVRCGVPVPRHDPTSLVEMVGAVDWLLLPAHGSVQRYVSFHSRVVVEVDIPPPHLPADVLPALSPLVAPYEQGASTAP